MYYTEDDLKDVFPDGTPTDRHEAAQLAAEEEAEYWHHINTEAEELIKMAESEKLTSEAQFLGRWKNHIVANRQIVDRIAQIADETVMDFTGHNLGYFVVVRNYQFTSKDS